MRARPSSMRARACGIVCIGVLLASCADSPSASTSVTASVTLGSQASPSASAFATGGPATSTGSPPAAAAIPDNALYAVLVHGLNLREGPGTASAVQTTPPEGCPTCHGQPIQLSAGDLVWVIQDQRVEGDLWHEVVVDQSYITGWISGGPDDHPWLAPFDRTTCPGYLPAGVKWYQAGVNPPLMTAMDEGPMPQSMRYPVCFADDSLEAVVYWPTPEEAGTDVPCPWSGPRWLLCYEVVNRSHPEDGSHGLAVYGDPQDRTDVTRGDWVTIKGHYNDPRSATCPNDLGLGLPATDPAFVADVLFCRAAFVLDDVERFVVN